MQTIRQEIIRRLSMDQHSAGDLSTALGIREKEVYDHLSHIRRSLVSRKKRLLVEPAQCLECRYVFYDRMRLTKPGRCPRCKGTHIREPKYSIS